MSLLRSSLARPLRGFTLLELLVVIAIVTVLASLGLGGLRNAIQKAEVARAQSQIQSLNAALAMYHADLRSYPRRQQGTTPAELLRDHGPYLYAALMNAPSPTLGGGPNAPYVRGQELTIGALLNRGVLAAAPMGSDGETFVRALNAGELTRASLPEFQREHGPESAEPLVFLDPWGNPWHCRIWKGVRGTLQRELVRNPPQRSGFEDAPHVSGPAPISGFVSDQPHSLGEVDIWSNGPNGINEYGAGDDVRSW